MAKILIVDDLESQIALMESVIKPLGHTTFTASNGQAALELARLHQPDLILLDIIMPEMDGFQTCRKLKKDPELSAIPVVMVTTKDQETDQFWAQKQGADAYVVKPFTPKLLTETIQRFI